MSPPRPQSPPPEINLSFESQKQERYDPETNPEYFDGILSKRIQAFIIDLLVIAVLWIAGSVVIVFLGILTLGILWLFWGGLLVLLVLGYEAFTLGGPLSATLGMRLMGIEMRTWYGERPGVIQAAAHSLLFYFSVTLTSFLILLVPFFNNSRRCVHDFLCGTVMINTEPDSK